MINNKVNELRNLIIVYNKENPKLQTLGNTFTNKSTGKLKYKEHIVIKSDDLSTSLTSSKGVMYREEVNGKYGEKWAKTNLLGKKENGENQYGLRYELSKDHWKNFSETERLNINILRNFGVYNKNVLIPYTFRMWVAIKAQDQWNILFRGQSSYQTRSQIRREDSFINLNEKISKMSNSEVYEYIKENTTMSQMFWIEQRYYCHFRNFNYYKKEGWEDLRKREMQDYKNGKIEDKDDLL